MESELTDEFRERLQRELKSGCNAVLILHILALFKDPVYGYDIIQQIKDASGDRIVLGPGTIYPLLKRLEKKKYLTSFWGRLPNEPDGVPRKYYQITSTGLQLYHNVLGDWQNLWQMINSTLTEIQRITEKRSE